MVDRIRALLRWRQLTPTQFADAIQVGRPIVSHILSERNKASLDVVQRIVAAFPEVALPWLLSGTGPMLRTAEQAALTTPATPQADLSAAAGEVPVPAAPAAAAPKTSGKAVRTPLTQPVARATGLERNPAANLLPTPEPDSGKEEKLLNSRGLAQNSRQPVQKFAVSSAPFLVTTAAPAAPGAADRRPLSPAGAAEYSNGPKSAVMLEAGGVPAGATAAIPPSLQASPRSEATSTPRGTDDAGQQSVVLAANKPIRRIVIFYQDGSFADFKPEG